MEIKRENTEAKAGEHATSSPEQRELWSMAELDDPRLLEKKGDAMRIALDVNTMTLTDCNRRSLYISLTLPIVGTLWIQRWPRDIKIWTCGRRK